MGIVVHKVAFAGDGSLNVIGPTGVQFVQTGPGGVTDPSPTPPSGLSPGLSFPDSSSSWQPPQPARARAKRKTMRLTCTRLAPVNEGSSINARARALSHR